MKISSLKEKQNIVKIFFKQQVEWMIKMNYVCQSVFFIKKKRIEIKIKLRFMSGGASEAAW